VTVANTGRRKGAAVPQLYLGFPSRPGVPQPPAQLKGFERVSLAPGESARVSFELDARSLSYWNTASDDWRLARGCVKVMVGSSSRHLPLRDVLSVAGARCRRHYD
jgi:beta-glucosidase